MNPLTAARRLLPQGAVPQRSEDEGGCGVIGAASAKQLEGKYLLTALRQMKNRGNGKGGGIAAAGLDARQLGVSARVLEEDYILQVAYLDPSARDEVESRFITPRFRVDKGREVAMRDYRKLGLEVPPPKVVQYFVRALPAELESFIAKHHLAALTRDAAEDEFVYQNTYLLNSAFYSSLQEKRAFVLSHAKNLVVFKLVGYGDDVIPCYKLENLRAHVWIGHHRYPTKGAVWHPGGAHPFIGLHDALVHNGDFSNYSSTVAYLAERGITPLFLTDTEVAALLFDVLRRTYGYPLEYLIEALAPTTERDFHLLPPEKQRIYREIQTVHLPSSPDGPWFFIIAANAPQSSGYELIGITDTSMLRPQVFALQGKELGLIASERQAIDAMLGSLHEDGKAASSRADRYWNARGGSHTDGGAFVFTVDRATRELRCADKFGREIKVQHPDSAAIPYDIRNADGGRIAAMDLAAFRKHALGIAAGKDKLAAVEALTGLMNLRYPSKEPRSALLDVLDEALVKALSGLPRCSWATQRKLPKPGEALAVDCQDFPVEGPESAARFVVKASRMGWKRLLLYHLRGHRFIGSGLGPESALRLDCYGNPGDYLGSGLDGAEVHVHGAGQDQLCQILKSGRVVIHGDVGQTMGYAAKGGEIFIRGNCAGRPLINAVGKPRVVINGTCLDYLAESFMAGDPLKGGGFVVLNGISAERGIEELETPYPGGNLLSLASGGAIYVRDPQRKVEESQLNGGKFAPFTAEDWKLILPYLQENERLFDITVGLLLTVDGEKRAPEDVYRKVVPAGMRH